jgi:uncharacterized protein (TIGR00369 family)
MLKFPLAIPFVEHLGFELHRYANGEAEVHLELDPEHHNSWQVAHGGVVMTLLDVAMAHAGRSVNMHEPGHGPGMATIEMKTSFMHPAEGRLVAKARLLHRSSTMAFCEGSVFDAQAQLCAHATGTFKYLRKLPAGDRTIKRLRHKES